jgi:CRP-like cAMP-binding protein
MEDVEVSSGEIFLQKGDLDSSMYLLIEGQVRVHDGDRTVADLGQGEVLGELALLDPAPRSVSVTAVTDSRLFRLDQEPFFELLEDHGEVARKMLQVMARRLRRSSSEKRQDRARDDLLGGLQEKLVRPV